HAGLPTALIHYVTNDAAACETAAHAQSVQLPSDYSRVGQHGFVLTRKCSAKSQHFASMKFGHYAWPCCRIMVGAGVPTWKYPSFEAHQPRERRLTRPAQLH